MFTLIRAFVRHPVAPNLAMVVMILAGLWALGKMTRQLLPEFELNIITVNVTWSGASAEDIEEAITQPLEDQLIGIESLKNIFSRSADSISAITLEFPESTEMGGALDAVKERVSQLRNLPAGAEDPQVIAVTRGEPLSRVVMGGPTLDQLKPLVRRIERELRAAGLTRIEINGLPEEELAIELPTARLSELNLSIG